MKNILVFLLCCLFCVGCSSIIPDEAINVELTGGQNTKYEGEPYTVLNENQPEFEEKTTKVFEEYSELDHLGRCGVAFANICKELMPSEERGNISKIKPSGWQSAKYDIVDGKYLYNRCHLIGHQLAGEDANKKNLITGTRYFNVEGMLPFENQVADYVEETGNHVLYRVTPIYTDDNLVADGVQMEAYSVEDEGEGICFNVLVHNIQPGIVIDYATGNSSLDTETILEEEKIAKSEEKESYSEYIINKNSQKFHLPDCSAVEEMLKKNQKKVRSTSQKLKKDGYEPCGMCNPD